MASVHTVPDRVTWFFSVSALTPAIHSLHMSQEFAGLVIVAIAGNAVENVVGVQLAARNQPDFAISVILNSSLQVALALTPVLVFVSLAFAGAHPDRLLSLALFEPASIPGPLSAEEAEIYARLETELAGLSGPEFMRAFVALQVREGVQLPLRLPGQVRR